MWCTKPCMNIILLIVWIKTHQQIIFSCRVLRKQCEIYQPSKLAVQLFNTRSDKNLTQFWHTVLLRIRQNLTQSHYMYSVYSLKLDRYKHIQIYFFGIKTWWLVANPQWKTLVCHTCSPVSQLQSFDLSVAALWFPDHRCTTHFFFQSLSSSQTTWLYLCSSHTNLTVLEKWFVWQNPRIKMRTAKQRGVMRS